MSEFLHGVALIEPAVPKRLIVPGVFANGDRDRSNSQRGEFLAFGRTEVALLVEDVVVRQQHLMLAEGDLAALEHGGSVPDPLAFVEVGYLNRAA